MLGSSSPTERKEPLRRSFDSQERKVVLGVCAMAKKTSAKPMQTILQKLVNMGDIEVRVFTDDEILHAPVEHWPLCDALITFFSEGFPLKKAEAYATLRRPFLINDVFAQHVLLDRRKVYAILQEHGIPVPPHIIVNRTLMRRTSAASTDVATSSTDTDAGAGAGQQPGGRGDGSAETVHAETVRRRLSATYIDIQRGSDETGRGDSRGESEAERAGKGTAALPRDTSSAQRGTAAGVGAITGTTTVPRPGSIDGGRMETMTPAAEDEGGQLLGNSGYAVIGSGTNTGMNSPMRAPSPSPSGVSSGHNTSPTASASSGGSGSFVWVDPDAFVEEEDFVELVGEGGRRITKPFVEKPVSGEDHNVNIYYPFHVGGGMKRLFRKVGDRSSEFFPGTGPGSHPDNSRVRRQGSFIYEAFMVTGGVDVKVYTVGPQYAHAEARKSPVVDGKVQRDSGGKEVRFPVLLSPHEKEIARKVSIAFRQRVCGFDLLRCKGKSYVCDVNGWSFVKNSMKYYADTATSLRNIILGAVAPLKLHKLGSERIMSAAGSVGTGGGSGGNMPIVLKKSSSFGNELSLMRLANSDEGKDSPELHARGIQGRGPSHVDTPPCRSGGGFSSSTDDGDVALAARTSSDNMREELRCVLCVVRHGDRTPKQKIKVRVTMAQAPIIDLLMKYGSSKKRKEAKLKSPQQLQELLDVIRSLLDEFMLVNPNRSNSSSGGGGSFGGDSDGSDYSESIMAMRQLERVREVLEQGGHFSGIYRKAQIKPVKWKRILKTSDEYTEMKAIGMEEPSGRAPALADGGKNYDSATNDPDAIYIVSEALLVMKWGGVLTHRGRMQAELYGRNFRHEMYPNFGTDGGGLLRLHSTYRHDLKIYSSDEGRVQMSAAAYAKGLLDLEGDLTPILISLVKKDASMLDAYGKGASEDIMRTKKRLYELMTSSSEDTPPDEEPCLWPMSVEDADENGADAAEDGAGGGAAPTREDRRHKERTSTEDATDPTLMDVILPPVHVADRDFSDLPQWERPGAFPDNIPSRPLDAMASLREKMRLVTKQLKARCAAAAVAGAPGGEPVTSNDQDSSFACASDRGTHIYAASAESSPVVARRGQTGVGAGDRDGAQTSAADASDVGDASPRGSEPYGGETIHLMHERWRKLEHELYKKSSYDISKIPDIYDTIKYDVIHNRHLRLSGMEDAYFVAKTLADTVIPSEYGLDSAEKLMIGSKICAPLLGKLLHDLNLSAFEEVPKNSFLPQSSASKTSPATPTASALLKRSSSMDGLYKAHFYRNGSAGVGGHASGVAAAHLGVPNAHDDDYNMETGPGGDASAASAASASAAAGGGLEDDDAERVKDGDDEHDPDEGDEDDEEEIQHRLDPEFAMDVNTPERHVRTRVYFTSESHIHSLLNVLRFCHLSATPSPSLNAEKQRLCSPEASSQIHSVPELDYLSNIIIRLYENRNAVDENEKFRIDIQVSSGTDDETSFENGDVSAPLTNLDTKDVKRVTSPLINMCSRETSLKQVEELLSPFAMRWKDKDAANKTVARQPSFSVSEKRIFEIHKQMTAKRK